MQQSKLCEGWVGHARFAPKRHSFRYRAQMVLLDLDEIDRVFAASRFWSVERFNLVQYRGKDYLGHSDNLKQAVKNRLAEENINLDGPVKLLTNLRHWGHCFNPVSFYFCYQADGSTLKVIVAEITNTPWGERHQYVLRCDEQRADTAANSEKKPQKEKFEFVKAFHVSPFMPMHLNYLWRFIISDDRIVITMNLSNVAAPDQKLFTANLSLRAAEITETKMTKIALGYPWYCFKIVAAIYWQAFRLWLKRVPFYSHPAKNDKHAASDQKARLPVATEGE